MGRGERINAGAFGQVFAVVSGEYQAAAKFVPKTPSAEGEVLFVRLDGLRNVVPVIDFGEHKHNCVILMPRGGRIVARLSRRIRNTVDRESVVILEDITDALADLDGKVVHRDLKPENVLRLDGRWCLADFGISRYAEAATAPDTRKFGLSATASTEPSPPQHPRCNQTRDVTEPSLTGNAGAAHNDAVAILRQSHFHAPYSAIPRRWALLRRSPVAAESCDPATASWVDSRLGRACGVRFGASSPPGNK